MATTEGLVCGACGGILVHADDAVFVVDRPRCLACARWAALMSRDDKIFLRVQRIAYLPSSEAA